MGEEEVKARKLGAFPDEADHKESTVLAAVFRKGALSFVNPDSES